MNGWPKRSNSFICSSTKVYSGGFGELFILIPYNGTKIAVCPERDFWDTPLSIPEIGFETRPGNGMEGFNYFLKTHLGFKSDSFDSMILWTRTPEFKERLEEITDEIKPHQFIPLIWERLAPARTGLRLLTMSEYVSERPKDKEVWFSGPCIGITSESYTEYFQK
jgi:hypothetical protein